LVGSESAGSVPRAESIPKASSRISDAFSSTLRMTILWIAGEQAIPPALTTYQSVLFEKWWTPKRQLASRDILLNSPGHTLAIAK
jgi:hypothetical protein